VKRKRGQLMPPTCVRNIRVFLPTNPSLILWLC